MKVRSHSKHPSLTPGKVYLVLGISVDCYRILNDKGDPGLYPRRQFRIVDRTRPTDWVTRIDDGAEYSHPHEIGGVGFFEDYMNDVPEARKRFWSYIQDQLTK